MATPTIQLEIDTPSAAAAQGYLIIGDPVHGKIGTGKIAPPQIYANQASRCRNTKTSRGQSSFDTLLFTPDAGTLTATLDNRTRVYDPQVNPDIDPGRALRLRVTYNAVTYSVWSGVIESWPTDYPTNSSHGDAVTQISANDGIGELAPLNVAENLPEQSTGDRLTALANLVGWSPSSTSIDSGRTTMPAAGQTISAWSAMLEAADSEMGELYVAGDGTLVFRDRQAIVTETRSRTSQATFGDSGSELLFAQPKTAFDRTQVRNLITVIYNDNGDNVVVGDSASQKQYGIRTGEVQAKITDPIVAFHLAEFLLSIWSQPTDRVESITIRPGRDPVHLWPQALGRELGDKISVKFQPPGGGARKVHDCFIRGISHEFSSAINDWTTTFVTQDASLWPSVFIIGTSTVGGTDTLWW